MVESEAILVTDHSAFKSKLQRQQQGLDVISSDPETRIIFCIHVKFEKFKRGRYPSLHLAKEGDLVRIHSGTLILSINIQF